MKQCTKCELLKNEEHFNTYRRFEKEYVRSYCRICERSAKREYKKRIKNLLNSEQDIIYGGTSIEYNELPNHYINEEQRIAVFRIMKLLGYSFSRSTGVWFKLPYKLPDGTFTNVKYSENYRLRLKKTVSIIPTNRLKELYKMCDEGKSNKEMATRFNVQTMIIEKYLHQRNKKKKSNDNTGDK